MLFKVLATSLVLSHAAWVFGQNCKVEIEGNDAMKFNLKEISVDGGCKEVSLTLKHVGKLPKTAMGHNWILTKEADAAAVAAASLKIGPAKDYIDQSDKRIIASTKMIGGGESDTISFPLTGLKVEDSYQFFCSFPGHIGLMKGKFIIQASGDKKK